MTSRKEIPNQKWLRENFKYHRDGYLIRKTRPSNNTFVGQVVRGTLHHTGYRYLRINGGSSIAIHRIIFKLKKGFAPIIIDHKDRNKLNNRIGNLRPATQSVNLLNQKIARNNTSGMRGLSFDKTRGYWRGEVTVNGRRHKVGFSPDKQKVENLLKALHAEKCRGIF